MGFLGTPYRIFALNLKVLKIKLKRWNKVNSDMFKIKKADCLEKIRLVDDLEEGRSISREERCSREALWREFQLLVCKKEFF